MDARAEETAVGTEANISVPDAFALTTALGRPTHARWRGLSCSSIAMMRVREAGVRAVAKEKVDKVSRKVESSGISGASTEKALHLHGIRSELFAL